MCPANESGTIIIDSDQLIQSALHEKEECINLSSNTNNNNERLFHGILHRIPVNEVINLHDSFFFYELFMSAISQFC